MLECNIRLTAATLPTLLANAIGTHSYMEYFEEVPLSLVAATDIMLVRAYMYNSPTPITDFS
ncbi:MAG: hypothetical protein ACFNNB_03235 [Candidatus Saccharimonas sp.]|jgi:hypothetical protein